MPITSIRYSAEININGLKRWVGAEASVPEGGSEDAELDLVLAFIERTNARVHGISSLNAAPLPPEPEVLPEIKIDRPPVDAILEGIMNAKDGSDLSGYKLLIKNRQTWTDAYNKRAKELGVIG